MPDPSDAGVAGVNGVAGCRLADEWPCTNDRAEPVWAGGAENIPTPAPALAAAFVLTGVGTAYDMAVLTGENNDACCSGGVGYKCQNTVSAIPE